MEVLKVLEKCRTPLFDRLFTMITFLGDEVIILGFAFVVFWCLDKRLGYGMIYSIMVGVIINQFLKGLFHVPRPWVRDPMFTIVESAREAATGYSFPSGHTQNSTVLFGSLFLAVKRKGLRVLLVAVIILIGFSRMYLGVHTPADVLAAWAVGALMVAFMFPLLHKAETDKRIGFAVNFGFILVSVLLLLFAEMTLARAADAESVKFAADGVSHAYTILGIALAFPIVWYIDLRVLKFDLKAEWWAQIIKCLVGVALVFALRIGLKPGIALVIKHEGVAGALRYFIIALFGGVVWPSTFRFWARLGNRRFNQGSHRDGSLG
jgi:membrane-associated phospholipid phosphatase